MEEKQVVYTISIQRLDLDQAAQWNAPIIIKPSVVVAVIVHPSFKTPSPVTRWGYSTRKKPRPCDWFIAAVQITTWTHSWHIWNSFIKFTTCDDGILYSGNASIRCIGSLWPYENNIMLFTTSTADAKSTNWGFILGSPAIKTPYFTSSNTSRCAFGF